MSEAAADPDPAEPPPPPPAAIHQFELGFPAASPPQWRLLGRLLEKSGLGRITGARRRAKPIRLLWHAEAPAEPAHPIASFTGEERQVEIGAHDQAVSARWLQGTVRGVADELPIARITLTGPRPALIQIALALADQGAFVPLASLEAQAIAVAEHRPPPPRHRGAAQVPAGTNVAGSLAFAIGQLVDAALHWASLIPNAQTSEPVHQMRVAVRRLRSLLGAPRKSVPGPLWHNTKTVLGNLARELGDARAWDVFLEDFGAAMAAAWPEDKRVTSLLARATKRRTAAYAQLRTDLAGDAMRRLTVELALFAALRPFEAEGDQSFWAQDCHAFATHALDRRLRKLRASGDDLTLLAPHALHEVRKNAKRLRYACELFASFWSAKAARKYLERLSDLQESLGKINDSATLEPLLADLGATGFAAGIAVGMATVQAQPALKQAQSAWKKLGSTEPFWQ